MSERVADDRAEVRPAAELPSSPMPAPTVKWGSQALRFDGPEPISAAPVETSHIPTPDVVTPASPLREKSRQLAEVSQFVLQFQEHLDDIERREQQLTQRLTEFASEERRFRLTAHHTEAELGERKAALLTQEAALVQRMTEFDLQQRDFEAAAERFDADRQALDQECLPRVVQLTLQVVT